MEGSYNEDETTQLSVSKRTWAQYLRENWLVILVVVLAVAGLVYWFYFRGAQSESGSAAPSSSMSAAEKFTIHRLRGGMY